MSSNDFYVLSPYDARYVEKLITQDYWVCTKCFELTSLGKDYQHCKCEPEPGVSRPKVDCPSGFMLCSLCAREIAGGRSRWSWLVCDVCKLASSHKWFSGSTLPIGRHSMMNRVSWPIEVIDDQQRAEQVSQMLRHISYQEELMKFGRRQAKALFDSEFLMEGEAHISCFQWRSSFPTSEEASKAAVKAFRKYVRDKLKGLS